MEKLLSAVNNQRIAGLIDELVSKVENGTGNIPGQSIANWIRSQGGWVRIDYIYLD